MISKHWDNVCQGWRHIVSELPLEKRNRIISNFNKLMLKHISTNNIKTSMDWGCGGGLLTKELKKFSKAIAVDLCEDSLNNCKKFANPDYSYQLPDSLDNFNYVGPQPKLILAHAVVWHFPSIEYFEKVIKIWTNIKPDYIAFNTKTTKGNNKSSSNYESNFLHALILNDKYVIKILNDNGYKLINKEKGETKTLDQMYFVFKQH